MKSIEKLRQLREETGISFSECRKALEESGGDIGKAKKVLRKKGMDFAKKRLGRETGKGIIDSYIHANRKVGVLLDVRCETDFVARSLDFQNMAHDICLHIAASAPRFIAPKDIPEDYLAGERKIYREQFSGSGKPEELISKIVEGKIDKLRKEICLLTQPFVKDQDISVKEFIDANIAKIGENIKVERFLRYQI